MGSPRNQLEEDLEEAVKSPDTAWLEVPSHTTTQEEATEEELALQEKTLFERWRHLLDSGLFQPLQAPSDYLQSHVVSKVLHAQDLGQERTLTQCLEEAVERGHPALAEEATRHLEELKYEPKAGHKADAEFSPPDWSEGVGKGKLHFDPKFQIDPIPYQDHQDKLEAAASQVPLNDGKDEEERQCLPLHVGIGLYRAKHPKATDSEAYRAAAVAPGHVARSRVSPSTLGRFSRMDN